MPQPLMRGDEAFDALAAVGVRGHRAAGQHIFKNMKQLLGDFKIALVAGMVKRDENFVGQTTAITRRVTCLSKSLTASFVCFAQF